MNTCIARLRPLAFGLALGIVWGLGVLIVGLFAANMEYGQAFVTLVSSVYYGYDASMGGSFVGAIWAFIDGLISGIIFAWLYNLCSGCKVCSKCPTEQKD